MILNVEKNLNKLLLCCNRRTSLLILKKGISILKGAAQK